LQSRWRFFADLRDDSTFMERLATVSERGKRGIVREFIRQWKGTPEGCPTDRGVAGKKADGNPD